MYMIKTYVHQLYFLVIFISFLCVESFLLSKAISNFLSDEPNVTIEHCSTKVTEGDNATVSCKATGSPTPETAWIREKTGEILSYSKIHQITGINRNETGAYVCLAWNGIGKNDSKSCLVVVQCKCTILFLFITCACLEMHVSVYVFIVGKKKVISSDPFGKKIERKRNIKKKTNGRGV